MQASCAGLVRLAYSDGLKKWRQWNGSRKSRSKDDSGGSLERCRIATENQACVDKFRCRSLHLMESESSVVNARLLARIEVWELVTAEPFFNI